MRSMANPRVTAKDGADGGPPTNGMDPAGPTVLGMVSLADWPYRAQAPDDHLSRDRVMWIIRRCGPSWSDRRLGVWFSIIAWKDGEEVMEFWFKDREIFTEFTMVWC